MRDKDQIEKEKQAVRRIRELLHLPVDYTEKDKEAFLQHQLGMDEYQQYAKDFRIRDFQLEYYVIGLCEESGEVAGKLKKAIRDNQGILSVDYLKDIIHELGDVLWYISMLADKMNIPLSDVAKINILKLERRKLNNTMHGSGDNR